MREYANGRQWLSTIRRPSAQQCRSSARALASAKLKPAEAMPAHHGRRKRAKIDCDPPKRKSQKAIVTTLRNKLLRTVGTRYANTVSHRWKTHNIRTTRRPKNKCKFRLKLANGSLNLWHDKNTDTDRNGSGRARSSATNILRIRARLVD